MAVFLLKVMKIPTQKGQHSCRCTELSLKRKYGIVRTNRKLQREDNVIKSKHRVDEWTINDASNEQNINEVPHVDANSLRTE